jgi:hypothetical protein
MGLKVVGRTAASTEADGSQRLENGTSRPRAADLDRSQRR